MLKKVLKCSLTVLLVFTLTAAVLCGCKKKDDGAVKIALSEVTHSVFYAPQYVAIEKGFFSEEGIFFGTVFGGE